MTIQRTVEAAEGDGTENRNSQKTCNRGNRIIYPGSHAGLVPRNGIKHCRRQGGHGYGHAQSNNCDRQQECDPV